MNDSEAPLRIDNLSQLDLTPVEEETKRDKSMWEISQTDNSISKGSSLRAADDQANFQASWKTAKKEYVRQRTRKSLFSRVKSRASIGPSSAQQDNLQQTVSPQRKGEGLGNRKTARRIVSAMFVVPNRNRSSKLIISPSAIDSAESSQASQSLDSDSRGDIRSIIFDEDQVSAFGGCKKKQVQIVESQSIPSESSEEDQQDEKQQFNQLVAEESSWEILRQRWAISSTSQFYNVWKIFEILLSFATALIYTYKATHLQTEEQRGSFFLLDIAFQLFFLISLAIHVLLDEHHPSSGQWTPASAFLKMIKQEEFVINVVTLIPFTWLTSPWFSPLFCQRLHLIKALRLKYGLGFLDYKVLKKGLHQFQIGRLQEKMKDPRFESSPREDSAKMTAIMLTTEVLKTLRLVVIISFFSFFTGSIWFIFSEYIHGLELAGLDNFISAFDLEGDDSSSQSAKLMYFAFTTVSTVGLGDLHPRNSPERVLCSVVMLFGVMATTMLMDNFSLMIKRLQDFGKPYDESKHFSHFMGTLKSFNEGSSLCKNFEARMEQYFHYRWSFNRNLAISTERDMSLYDELPGRLKTELYVDFLFKGFIDQYRVILDLGQSHFPYKRKYFREVLEKQTDVSQIDWTRYYTDYTHDDFLVSLLRELEPIKFNYGKLLLRQGQDPVTEVYFPMRGELQFGYNHLKFLETIKIEEMNIPFDPTSGTYQEVRGRITQNFKQQAQECRILRKRFDFPVILGPGQTVGLFEIIFKKPSQFSVRILQNEEGPLADRDTVADCYFIRQSSWTKILNTDDGDEKKAKLVERFRTNALTSFIRRVYQPIREHKQCFVQQANLLIFKDYDQHKLRNEDLYKEIAKPLIDVPKMRKLKKLSSKKSSLQLICEKRKRSIMMSQGISLIANSGSKSNKQGREEKRNQFESLDDVASMIAAGTLDLHHKPFKHISLLSLHREAHIKEEPVLNEIQTSIKRKVHLASQMMQALAANIRLLKSFLDRTQASLEEDESRQHQTEAMIQDLKAEVASLKARLKEEEEKNSELRANAVMLPSEEVTPKLDLSKRGSFFSFNDKRPRKSIQNEPVIPNWSVSQKKESLSDDDESSRRSSSSATSSPAFLQVHSLHEPKSTSSLTKLEKTMSQFSLVQAPSLNSESPGSPQIFLQKPFSLAVGRQGPVLGVEINLLSALKQAGVQINLKDEGTVGLPGEAPHLDKAESLKEPSVSFLGSKVPQVGSSGGSGLSEALSEAFFKIPLDSETTKSTLLALPTGKFNSTFGEDSSRKNPDEVESLDGFESHARSYGKRLNKLKKAKICLVPSPILEENNDEEASDLSAVSQTDQGNQSDLNLSCSSSVKGSGVESRIGESQFFNMMAENEGSESLSCADISDIKAQIPTEGETPEGRVESDDQDTSPNTCNVEILQKKEDQDSSDEPNRASPIGPYLCQKTVIMV